MTIQLVSAPIVEPVSLAETKVALRVTGDEEDEFIATRIVAAREKAEHETGRAFIAQTYRLVLDAFPTDLWFAKAPVRALASVKYLDIGGVLQTVAPADYVSYLWSDPPRIAVASGVTWPTTSTQTGAVAIDFRAGYAAPVIVDAAYDTITVPEWEALGVGYPVRLSNVGGVLPSPLKPKTDYYVQSVVSPGVYTLAATLGGTMLDITDGGTGTSLLGEVPWSIRAWIMAAVGTFYANRENVVVERSAVVAPMPFVDGLLDRYRTYSVS